MFKPAKIVISVLSVVAATVFGFSVPAFASDNYSYNDIIDAGSAIETALAVLEQNPQGAYAYSTGIRFSNAKEADDAADLMYWLLQTGDEGFCSMGARQSGPRHYEEGSGFGTSDWENYYVLFVGWRTEGDHSATIGNMRSAYEQLKAAAQSFSGMSDSDKYRACTEYVLNAIDTYRADSRQDHAYSTAMLNRAGCCQAYTGMLTTLASLSGLKIGTESFNTSDGSSHCLNYIKTADGIRYIDACWMDTNNSHNENWYMFANESYENILNEYLSRQ